MGRGRSAGGRRPTLDVGGISSSWRRERRKDDEANGVPSAPADSRTPAFQQPVLEPQTPTPAKPHTPTHVQPPAGVGTTAGGGLMSLLDAYGPDDDDEYNDSDGGNGDAGKDRSADGNAIHDPAPPAATLAAREADAGMDCGPGNKEAVWHRVRDDESGNCYYWNRLTNEVTWEVPHAVDTALACDTRSDHGPAHEAAARVPDSAADGHPLELSADLLPAAPAAAPSASGDAYEAVGPGSPAAAAPAGGAPTLAPASLTPAPDSQLMGLAADAVFKCHVLSRTPPVPSASFSLACHLEARLEDFGSGALTSAYFAQRLGEACAHLAELEQEGLASGWTRLWDLASHRYYFANVDSGQVAWDLSTAAGEAAACAHPCVPSSQVASPASAPPVVCAPVRAAAFGGTADQLRVSTGTSPAATLAREEADVRAALAATKPAAGSKRRVDSLISKWQAVRAMADEEDRALARLDAPTAAEVDLQRQEEIAVWCEEQRRDPEVAKINPNFSPLGPGGRTHPADWRIRVARVRLGRGVAGNGHGPAAVSGDRAKPPATGKVPYP